jgi:hypothetical protein
MRVRYFLVAAACALCLLALPQPQPQPSAEPQASVTQIDFDALRAEAKGALEALQHPSQWQAALDVPVELRPSMP